MQMFNLLSERVINIDQLLVLILKLTTAPKST